MPILDWIHMVYTYTLASGESDNNDHVISNAAQYFLRFPLDFEKIAFHIPESRLMKLSSDNWQDNDGFIFTKDNENVVSSLSLSLFFVRLLFTLLTVSTLMIYLNRTNATGNLASRLTCTMTFVHELLFFIRSSRGILTLPCLYSWESKQQWRLCYCSLL